MDEAPDRSGVAAPGDAERTGVGPLLSPVPRWAGIGIFLILLVGALGFARPFLVPVVLGTLLTLVFSPVRRALDRRLPSVVSALLIVGTLLAALVGAVVMLAGPATEWIEDAPRIASRIEAKLNDLRGAAQTVIEAGDRIGDLANANANSAGVQEVVVRDESFTSSVALLAPAVLAQLVFVLALLFFLLSSGDLVYEKIVHVMPTFGDKRQAIRIAFDIERKLSRYLFTITVINAVLGVAIGLAMWAFGMPNPLLFAVVGFLLNYVPYLGAMTGAGLAVVVGLVSLAQVHQAVAAGGAYLALASLTGQFVTPYFVSRQLRLNTVVVFLVVAMCAWLWSVVGMLIATPLLVAVRVFCEHVPALETFGTFLSARGAELEDDDAAA